MRMNSMEVHRKKAEPWEITLVDTGETSMTGGRLKQVRNYVGDQAFCFTYSDGVADVDITAQIAHHKTYGRLGTVTAVEPLGCYEAVQLGENAAVSEFQEKPQR
jgi:glucose-1-phosphate cytidylyltransferase